MNIEHKTGNCNEYQYIKTWEYHRAIPLCLIAENKYNVLRKRSLKLGKQASHDPIHKISECYDCTIQEGITATGKNK